MSFDYDQLESDTNPCPLCAKPIYEDADYCLHCGEYIVRSTSFLEGRSLWFRAFWVLLVAFLILQMLGFCF